MLAENSLNSRENSQISAQNSLNFAENSARNSQFFVQNGEKIAVIVPCYNEEKSVVAVIDELFAVLPNAEIFVFDNNSTDKSAALVREKIATLNANLGQNGVKQNEVNFLGQNSTQTLANERERERESKSAKCR